MFFRTTGYKIFLIALVAFDLAAWDQNNATEESQPEDAEKITLPKENPTFEQILPQAENGDPEAQHKLGVIYIWGDRGVPRDYDEAMRWFHLAADQGYAEAQFELGNIYKHKDYAEAMRWYRLAADQGHAYAQFYLGDMYSVGEGAPQDPVEAVRWFRLAADQGHVEAQYYLAAMYKNGEGAPENKIAAYLWYSLAAAQGDNRAFNKKNALTVKMTPEQIDEAERLTEEWLKAHQ